MGREIRRVPPNWKHPLKDNASGPRDFQPMLDETYDDAAQEWTRLFMEWESGERERVSARHPDLNIKHFWDWGGPPPDEESHRPKFTEEPTWFQVYETVSEGTPVTPPFATPEELAMYLSTEGDFWQQNDLAEGRMDSHRLPIATYSQAMSFVSSGYAPSLIISNKGMVAPYHQEDLGAQEAKEEESHGK